MPALGARDTGPAGRLDRGHAALAPPPVVRAPPWPRDRSNPGRAVEGDLARGQPSRATAVRRRGYATTFAGISADSARPSAIGSGLGGVDLDDSMSTAACAGALGAGSPRQHDGGDTEPTPCSAAAQSRLTESRVAASVRIRSGPSSCRAAWNGSTG